MGCERVTAWGMSSGAGMGTSVPLGLAELAQLVCPCTSPRVPVGGDGAGGGPSPWEGAARGALRPQQPPRGFLVPEWSLAGGAGRTGWVGQGPGGAVDWEGTDGTGQAAPSAVVGTGGQSPVVSRGCRCHGGRAGHTTRLSPWAHGVPGLFAFPRPALTSCRVEEPRAAPGPGPGAPGSGKGLDLSHQAA